MAKYSKHFRIREMQKRKDQMITERAVTEKYNGNVPAYILWELRAERLGAIHRGY